MLTEIDDRRQQQKSDEDRRGQGFEWNTHSEFVPANGIGAIADAVFACRLELSRNALNTGQHSVTQVGKRRYQTNHDNAASDSVLNRGQSFFFSQKREIASDIGIFPCLIMDTHSVSAHAGSSGRTAHCGTSPEVSLPPAIIDLSGHGALGLSCVLLVVPRFERIRSNSGQDRSCLSVLSNNSR